MIDFIKFNIINPDIEKIKSNKLLDFFSQISEMTGEMKPVKVSQVNCMKVIIRADSYVEVKGSIHEYYHGNNYGDFKPNEIEEAVKKLCSELEVNPDNCIIRNIEIGVNIELDTSPKEILKNCVVNYKGEPITGTKVFNGKGYQIEFEKSHYLVKLYDKGMQYKADNTVRGLNINNLLRIEIRVKKMQHLDKRNFTLSELCKLDELEKLSTHLRKAIEDTLIVDNEILIVPDDEIEFERLYENIKNPRFWIELKPKKKKDMTDKEYQVERNKYYKFKSKAKRLLKQFDLLKIKTKILEEYDSQIELFFEKNKNTKKNETEINI